MKTNKAIEEVSGYINFRIYMGLKDDGSLRDKKFKEEENNKKDQIITLLKRGEENEAYRKIVEYMKENFGHGILENKLNGIGIQLSQFIGILEQKYLKEV